MTKQCNLEEAKRPPPHNFSLTKKWAVLLRADLSLLRTAALLLEPSQYTLRQKCPSSGHFGAKASLRETGNFLSKGEIGQNFYQTYARTRVERGFFSCPFLPQTQENKQKMLRNGTFFFGAKARLRTTLVIFPSDESVGLVACFAAALRLRFRIAKVSQRYRSVSQLLLGLTNGSVSVSHESQRGIALV